MLYKCLNHASFEDQHGYQLIPIREEDMESIREWRNAQIDILRQNKPISSQEQSHYFHHVLWPSFVQEHPHQILFSYLYKTTCIGYGGLTHIDWVAQRAEVSFLLNPQRMHEENLVRQDLLAFLNLLVQVAFEDLGFHRLFTEAYAFRTTVIKILEEYGFEKEGQLKDHVYKKGQWHDSIIHGFLANKIKNKSSQNKR